MLEKTEGAIQRHWQNWVHKTHDEDKQNSKTQHNTETKKMNNVDHPINLGVNPCVREGYAVPASYKTSVMLEVV